MRERIERLIEQLASCVGALDPEALSDGDADAVVSLLARGERLCAAGRAVASARVLRSRTWRAAGYRTPAQWLASRTHTSLATAITAVETAHRLRRQPVTRDAFVSGALSEVQAAEISAAVAADPRAEPTLLAAAERDTLGELRQRCRAVRAAAAADEDVNERIRRGRYLRRWTDHDGAVRLDARLAPDDGAGLLATIDARAARLADEAWRSGQREPAEAYAADALVGLSGEARPVVHLHVDQAALERGRLEPGERCEIEGVGPVPVAVARRLATQGVVKVVASEGADVTRIAHLGRQIPPRLRTAVETRDRICVVPGCEVRTNLEIDHVIELADGGITRLDNLARLCRWHHGQKTYHGWRLGGAPGEWTWSRVGRAGAPGGVERPVPGAVGGPAPRGGAPPDDG